MLAKQTNTNTIKLNTITQTNTSVQSQLSSVNNSRSQTAPVRFWGPLFGLCLCSKGFYRGEIKECSLCLLFVPK